MARFTLGNAGAPKTSNDFYAGANAFGAKRVELPRIPIDVDETSGLAVWKIAGNSDKSKGAITPDRYFAILSGTVVERTRQTRDGEEFITKEIELTCAQAGTDNTHGTFRVSLRCSSESQLVVGESVDTTKIEALPFLNPLDNKVRTYYDAPAAQ